MEDSERQIAELAAELVSLATFANRAPTDNGAKIYSRQADELAQRANRLGYPSVADAIDTAKARETWAGRSDGLRKAATIALDGLETRGQYADYLLHYDREFDDREPLSFEDWSRIHGPDPILVREARG